MENRTDEKWCNDVRIVGKKKKGKVLLGRNRKGLGKKEILCFSYKSFYGVISGDFQFLLFERFKRIVMIKSDMVFSEFDHGFFYFLLFISFMWKVCCCCCCFFFSKNFFSSECPAQNFLPSFLMQKKNLAQKCFFENFKPKNFWWKFWLQ